MRQLFFCEYAFSAEADAAKFSEGISCDFRRENRSRGDDNPVKAKKILMGARFAPVCRPLPAYFLARTVSMRIAKDLVCSSLGLFRLYPLEHKVSPALVPGPRSLLLSLNSAR